jgi:hypothetical protein
MAERKLDAPSAKSATPGKNRGPTNAERRLRRLTAGEPDSTQRGILELFAEGDEHDDADVALTREAADAEQ